MAAILFDFEKVVVSLADYVTYDMGGKVMIEILCKFFICLFLRGSLR